VPAQVRQDRDELRRDRDVPRQERDGWRRETEMLGAEKLIAAKLRGADERLEAIAAARRPSWRRWLGLTS
jgi:hypothetical protein